MIEISAMKIGAAINGSLISERSARYALLHAKAMNAALVLLFNHNTKDSFDKVRDSVERLRKRASEDAVQCSFVESKADSEYFINHSIEEQQLDIIYCSTRAEKSFFEYSFSERLVNSAPSCDVAVVKVVGMQSLSELGRIGLYARNQKLRIDLFNMATSLCKSLDAKLVMTTNIEERKKKLLDLPFRSQRRKLWNADRNLQAYLDLANLIGIKSTIYHLFEEDVKEEQLSYVLSRDIDLLIFEAYKWPFVPLSLKNPAEELFKRIPVDCILYYPYS